MANSDKNMDQYFRERLSSHEVKPSKLAWEKLESQLYQQQQKTAFPWLRVAAVGLLLIGFGFAMMGILRRSDHEILDKTAAVEQPPQLETEIEKNQPSEIAALPESSGMVVDTKPLEKIKPAADTQARKQLGRENQPSELLAVTTTAQIEEVEVSVPDIELPELKLDETVAETLAPVEEAAPAYRVIIKSSGIKEEPQKQNLIAGIENKVEKIGGLISKVEQGFADLQDAKDNLFDVNAAKKEKSPK